MPAARNKSSVIVPCCDGERNGGGANGDESVQRAALTHLQGSGPDVPAGEVGAHTERR